MNQPDHVVSREDLVTAALRIFFEKNVTNQELYTRFRAENIRPRILEFWFLRYCPAHHICIPRLCDGVTTPVSTLYKQHLASFHKQFFSITRIPRRDRTHEVHVSMTIGPVRSGSPAPPSYKHTLAEWNVIRFLLQGNAVLMNRFLQNRTEVEIACRLHRKSHARTRSADDDSLSKRQRKHLANLEEAVKCDQSNVLQK